MKKLFFISVVLLVASGYIFFACKQQTISHEKTIENALLLQVEDFEDLCKKMLVEAESKTVDDNQLQHLFLETRLAYKSIEWAAEYFEPATSRFVNGQPVPEVDITGQVSHPAGLQVIEGFLFPGFDSAKKQELIDQLKLLQAACYKYKKHFKYIDIFDWQVFDAVKLEVFRIESLGIAGFDDPLTLKSMLECAAGLKSLQKVISYYENGDTQALSLKFYNTIEYLSNNQDFNLFDRAKFITIFCNPLTKDISDLEEKLKIKITRYNRLLNQDATTLFDKNAFNVNAYSPNSSSFTTDDKVALGKVLFADQKLSGTGTRSCRSCHQPEKAFTDGLVKNTVINSNNVLRRNTPTLINAALQAGQFYDLRVNTLEDQSLDVVQSSLEMHGSMKVTVQRLWSDSAYRKMFTKAFPEKNRNGIDTFEVMNAIASYVRSLVLLNSRFDDYMGGNKAAMSAEEINGFNLFMGKAKCATCHYMPLFNGTFPPRYVTTESEVIGVPASIQNKEIDSDLGRYDIIKTESFRHAFKIPTVRNAIATAPYMHNGVFTTLQQVIDFYNKGGGKGLGLKADNQTLPFDKLKLTEKEKSDIIAFISSLNSR